MLRNGNKKLFGFAYVIAGFVFLANPYIDMLDILPDFIGYLLILAGISRMAKLDDRLTLAAQKLTYLAVLSVLRLFAFAYFLSYDSTMTLLLTFSFGVAEVILILVCFSDFFGGIEYLLRRYEGYKALSLISNIKFLTLVFYIIKIVLCVLPDTIAILEVEAATDISASPVYMEIVGYKEYAIMLFALIVLILGIWWYREILKYFKAINEDAQFLSALEKAYKEQVSTEREPSKVTCIRLSFILTALGLVFYVDIFASMIDILPDFVAALLMWGGVIALRKAGKKLNIFFVLAFAFQIVQAVLVKKFAYLSVTTLGLFPLKNAVILAVSTTVYSVFGLLFLSEVFDVPLEYSGKVSRLSKRFGLCLWLYGTNLMLTAVGVIIPVLYTVVAVPKIVLMIVMTVVALRQYYLTFDEYTTKLSG